MIRFLVSLFTCTVCVNAAAKFDNNQHFLSVNSVSYNNAKGDVLPSDVECGVLETSSDILPWMVYIPLEPRRYSPGSNLRCAGTLINREYVITQKSCLTFVLSEVHLGVYDTSKNTTLEGRRVLKIPVSERVINESYDIILLRLAEEVQYTDEIRPICLPFENFKEAAIDDVVYTSGWVEIFNNVLENQAVNIMKVFRATVTYPEQCKTVTYGGASSNIENLMCVRADKESDDRLCDNDQGSPIMYNDNGHWVLQGILTWMYRTETKGCETQGYKITRDVLEWIVKNIRR